MNAIARRIAKLERRTGAQNGPTRYGANWWTCYARIGHEDEDIAEAARLGGVDLGPLDVVLYGFMDPASPCHWPLPPMERWIAGGAVA